MPSIPAIVSKRLNVAVPRFKKILIAANERDVNESDTVTIVTDMLEEIFGFDKYSEITREFAIQGTYCDLAVKTGKQVDYLIEVKAIGIDLKDSHLKQAVNYASREGIKWVVLTNGMIWQIHRVTMDKRLESELVCTMNFDSINPKKSADAEILYLLCKRGLIKDNIDKFYEYKQSVNRYTVGALLASEAVSTVVRKEMRKLKPGISVTTEEIQSMIVSEVIKREVIDSDSAKDAQKQIDKYQRSIKRAKAKKVSESLEKNDKEQTPD